MAGLRESGVMMANAATGWGRAVPALVMTLCIVLAGCQRTPPEQRLRDSIAGMQAAVEQRDAGAIGDALATDFVGPDSLDRDGARRMAQLMFLRHNQVGMTLGPLDVQLKGEYATVRFAATLTGGSGQLLPDSANVYNVETGWREVDGEWRLINASWTPKL